MQFTRGFLLFLVGVFLIAAVTAPVAKLFVDQVRDSLPAVAETLRFHPADDEYDFGRVFRRWLMLMTLIGLMVFRRRLGWGKLEGIGVGEPRWPLFGAGMALGVLTLAVLLGTMLLFGERAVTSSLASGWPARLGGLIVAALVVGLIEETFFRGWVLGGLLRDLPRSWAVLGGSAFYSIVHFLRGSVPVGEGFDLTIGAKALGAMAASLARPAVLLPLVGLTLVGVVLSYGYLWTRSLPFAIGLHAGWVLMLKLDGLILEVGPNARGGTYGEQGTLASFTTWALVLLTLALLWFGVRRFYPKHLDDQ